MKLKCKVCHQESDTREWPWERRQDKVCANCWIKGIIKKMDTHDFKVTRGLRFLK